MSTPFVTSSDACLQLTFGVVSQIIRIIIVVVLYYAVKYSTPKTEASKLEQEWLQELLAQFILFFIFINMLLLCLISEYTIYITVRVFGGSVVTLYAQIVKGFYLMDELPENYHTDSEFLHYLRIGILASIVVFVVYLMVSCCCLLMLFGCEGQRPRHAATVRSLGR